MAADDVIGVQLRNIWPCSTHTPDRRNSIPTLVTVRTFQSGVILDGFQYERDPQYVRCQCHQLQSRITPEKFVHLRCPSELSSLIPDRTEFCHSENNHRYCQDSSWVCRLHRAGQLGCSARLESRARHCPGHASDGAAFLSSRLHAGEWSIALCTSVCRESFQRSRNLDPVSV